MMSAADATPPASRAAAGPPISRHLLTILLAIGGLVYAGFIGMNIGACAGGSDSSGYLNNARLLWNGRVRATVRTVPGAPSSQLPVYAYTPLGFIPTIPSKMVPTYPIGLPLLVDGTAALTGTRLAPQWTIWWHALAGVALMFLLGRVAGLSPGWAALGALLLAVCPLHVVYSLQMMSDVPATTWATATIVFAWLSRGNRRWALLAGFSLGWAVLLRPTNAIMILPAAVVLGADWRRWLGFVAAGVPAAITLLLYNWRAYGHPLDSGYGRVGELFQSENLSDSLAHYAEWLPVLLTPLGLLALGLPFCARQIPRWSAALALWVLGFLALYAFYYHTHETWWYLRFVLPAFPAAWIAALLVLREILRRLGWEKHFASGSSAAWLAGGSAAVAIFAYSAHWNRTFYTRETGRGELKYENAIEWMQKRVPANAVLAAMQTSGALFYYTDFPIVRWDQIEEKDFAVVARAAAAAGRPLFALLVPFEEERAFVERRLAGHWSKAGAFDDMTLWRYEPGAP
jgi:hypothetical protein